MQILISITNGSNVSKQTVKSYREALNVAAHHTNDQVKIYVKSGAGVQLLFDSKSK